MSHVDLGLFREGGLRSHVDLGTIGLTGPRSQDDMGQNPRWYTALEGLYAGLQTPGLVDPHIRNSIWKMAAGARLNPGKRPFGR